MTSPACFLASSGRIGSPDSGGEIWRDTEANISIIFTLLCIYIFHIATSQYARNLEFAKLAMPEGRDFPILSFLRMWAWQLKTATTLPALETFR
jgi:hypothetical protein